VRALVLQYYFVLRSVLRGKSRLRLHLTRCRHCRIFFLTHPCNAKRRDLACPFGCRETHRQRRSTQRSVEYYRTEEGKIKKKIQNDKRNQRQEKNPSGDPREEGWRELVREEFRWDAGMVEYVRRVTSWIEGRRVGRGEVLEMLARSVRQHRLAHLRRIDYVMEHLRGQAP